MKLGELIIKAYRDAGEELPVKPAANRIKPTAMILSTPASERKKKKKTVPKKKPGVVPAQGKPVVIRVKHPQPTVKPSAGAKKNSTKKPDRFAIPEQPFDKQFDLQITDTVSPAWGFERETIEHALLQFNADGRHLQFKHPIPRLERQQHEVRIGLDFGTSTVKAVIGDSALKKAFAVPFFDSVGVSSYLLPTRLYLTNGVASLYEGEESFQDLKLRLIDGHDDEDNLLKVALYLALVLRYVRSWLLEDLAPIYGQYELLWSLAIGLPSSHLGEMEVKYRRLTIASWILSRLADKELTIQHAMQVMSEMAVSNSLDELENAHEVELEVIPEIAAQVYGYVNSDGFDPNGQKVFLMADVGGGTVDAALFRVTKSKGKNNFQFYTTTVQATGVFYLHEYRLSWWQRAAILHVELSQFWEQIADSICSTKTPSEIPRWVQDYFSGTSVTFAKPEYNPDKTFYRSVINQVRGGTFMAARKKGFWSPDELRNTPFYLCGGGSRAAFYDQLIADLKQVEGYSWIKTDYRRLLMPNNLEAPGLPVQDYDRLSVAYGLSLGGIGSVVKELPKPPEKPVVNDSWKNNYVDASML